MTISDQIAATPWDREIFGIDTYELKSVSRQVLEEASMLSGHFTVKTTPLASKRLLHEYGFYYCDTLIEPFCSRECLIHHHHESARISRDASLDDLRAIGHGAFTHGRFHRDFNLDRGLADRRYDNWLVQLYHQGNVYGLFFQEDLAGFIALSGSHLALHAVSSRFRGRGLAKYLWSRACLEFFQQGFSELTSSVSVSNVAVVNLYASLGFRFRNPVDVYHRIAL